MIDSMFQEGTDQALDDMVRRPRPDLPPEQGFSVLGALRGVPRGVAAAAANTLAFGAEVTGAFGETAGATGYTGGGGGMFSLPTEEEKKQREEARRKLIDTGPQFSNEAGDILRTRAKEIMPDPTSTHASEQIIAGITQFATQAVGYTLATGPAAPFLLAGDVGMAESDKLKQQGVDLGTRTAAGAVAGVAAGASIAVPVAIPGSVAKTAAAVVVGGPGSFMAQNAAERAILEHGGYDKIADTYDPFDPVGIALSTIVPAGFGAWAVSGARARPAQVPPTTIQQVVQHMESRGQRYGKDGQILTSPKGAKGEMQVLDSTNLDPGYGVRPAADNSPAERARVGRDYITALQKHYGDDEMALAAYNWGPGNLDKALAKAKKSGSDWRALLPAETSKYVADGSTMLRDGRIGATADADGVAAARTRQTAAAVDSYRLTPDDDLAGINRHQQAMERAHDQMAAGEPVRVDDLLSLDDVRTGRLLDDMIAEAESRRAAALPEAGNLADPGQIRDLRAQIEQLQSQRPDDSPATIKARAKELQEADGLSYKRATTAAEKETRTAIAEHEAQLQRLTDMVESNARAQRASEEVGRLDSDLEALRAQRGELDAPASSPRRLAMAIREAFAPPVETPLRAPRSARAPAPAAAEARPQEAGAPASAAPAPAKAEVPRGEPAGKEGGGSGDQQAAALDARAQQAVADAPDLMVQLDGMDSPVRAADLLERIKKEAADDAQDASLLDVAATCFLRQQ